MVNRVFCYSDDEARKNGNSTSISKIIIQIIGIVFAITIGILVGVFFFMDLFFNMTFFIGFISVSFIGILYYSINVGIKFRQQLMGFATDTENNIYCINKLNNGEEFLIGGMAAEGILDATLGKSSMAGDLAKGVGTAMTFYELNKSAKIMQNADVIAKIVENATTTTGVEVKQILKVYDCIQYSNKVKIKCDFKIMKTGKIKNYQNIVIYKAFNCFDDLIGILINKK